MESNEQTTNKWNRDRLIQNRMTALWGMGVGSGGIEQKKEKGFVDMDNSVMIVGWGSGWGWMGIREINGNIRENTIKKQINWSIFHDHGFEELIIVKSWYYPK